MDLILDNLQIPIELDGMDQYLKTASEKLGVVGKKLTIVKILSKELDLRNKEEFFYKISIVVRIPSSFDNNGKFREYINETETDRKSVNYKERPIVIGFGPAGMFAALELISYGIKPIIFERGKRIEERSLDVKRFIIERKLEPDSNIQFGEGGAGSFSDGKLFSRRNRNTGYVSRVLGTF
ncbi:MAG: dehydrogenase, partial [Desulfobacteraceae bacterium]|nr:dehydrogenase [Desulfobacteraceae bacterium]